MNAIFADVIIDISVSSLDRVFQYHVPDHLADDIYCGCQVDVPFGRGGRLLRGVVTGISDRPTIEADRIKDISAVIRDVLHYIYHAPKEHPEPKSSYWMLVAVHGLTRDLIPLLNPADASALAEDYTALYPRRERFPAQKQVLSALEKTAKQ